MQTICARWRPSRVRDQARVTAGAERAVDRQRARRRVERADQLAGKNGDVRAAVPCQGQVSPLPALAVAPGQSARDLGGLRCPAPAGAWSSCSRSQTSIRLRLPISVTSLARGRRARSATAAASRGPRRRAGPRMRPHGAGAAGRARPRPAGRDGRAAARCVATHAFTGQIDTQGSSSLARTSPSARRAPELGRDREPVLRIQRVLELPQKCQARKLSLLRIRDLGWRGGRNPAIPVRFNVGPTVTHFLPQCNTVREFFPLRRFRGVVDAYRAAASGTSRLT